MGNPSRSDLHPQVADWGRLYRGNVTVISNVTSRSIYENFNENLKNYFRLCALARSTTALPSLKSSALLDVFPVRSLIERSIISTIEDAELPRIEKISGILKNNFFGFSRKQGASRSMPLHT